MAKYSQTILPSSPKAKPSAFIKRSYRRGIALIGTSSLVLGFGVSTSTPAYAAAPFPCVNDGTDNDNTAEPVVGNSTASRLAILDVLEDHSDICLDGNFVISEAIMFNEDIHVYGVGDSSIESGDGGVFISAVPTLGTATAHNITIENLDVINSVSEEAVLGNAVSIKDSRFSNNNSGAVYALERVVVINSIFENNIGAGAITVTNTDPSSISYITDSTFLGNKVEDEGAEGGAVLAYSVLITNSTFSGNSAVGAGAIGGAVAAYGVIVLNSTFLDNKVEGTGAEGGAIYAIGGQAYFNTFVDNEAPLPPELGDVPGNAIYKSAFIIPGFDGAPDELFDINFAVAANIFAGESEYPQLGIGGDAGLFIDEGGNVFSNTFDIETDISQDTGSEFGASLSSIFGTDSPALATFSPNSNGTQTISVSPSGRAVDVVPSLTFTSINEELAGFNSYYGLSEEYAVSVDFDQRGGARSNPADAGAFEITSAPAPATSTPTASLAKTGNQNSWWFIVASATLLAFGGFATAVTSRLRRRSN
jgi:hypothetical protein